MRCMWDTPFNTLFKSQLPAAVISRRGQSPADLSVLAVGVDGRGIACEYEAAMSPQI